ncbi:hypothetical protein LWI29_025221 [Acer saccharum]|uniref:Uncharacterized protein n=1 Tax=Acer saccharum TaxID=4024 RepID=A0AA39SGC2_ACESA|nr:hypothetical protein LWI29_025221 [Acer saccharum]
MGDKKFEVKLVEEESPVDMVWLENFLELRKNQDQGSMDSWLDKERFQTSLPMEVSEIDTSSNPKEGRVVVYKELSCQSRKAELTAKQGQLGIGKEKRGKVGEKNVSCVSIQDNVEKDLEKRRSTDKGVVSSSEESHWSSEEEIGVHIFLNSHKVKGDCSKRSGVGRPKFGRHIIRPKKVVREELVSNIKEVEIISSEVGGSADACVSSDSRGIREDIVKATVAATKDQMVIASIAAEKAHVEKNVDVERA